MDIVSIEDAGRPRNVVFDRMRYLSMTSMSWGEAFQLDLFLQSPMLEPMEWRATTPTTQSRNYH